MRGSVGVTPVRGLVVISDTDYEVYVTSSRTDGSVTGTVTVCDVTAFSVRESPVERDGPDVEQHIVPLWVLLGPSPGTAES